MEVIKSPNDTRNYETYQLNNKLRVFIITDDDSKTCATALSVGVGSLDDTYEGIAHFLEHMLFMGSKEYPDEHHFMKFINDNGGMTNAYTADRHTNYYFNVECNAFLEAFKIFSGFFTNPLLKKDCVDREINAVNSEHEKNINDDMWRHMQISKKIINEKHPLSKFSTGSLKTLKFDTVHDEVKKFYEMYYSSNIMNLVLFVNNDFNKKKLKKLIEQTFGMIKNKNVSPKREFGQILNPSKLLYCVPVSNEDKITLIFQIETLTSNPAFSPNIFLCQLIGHEGNNSIHKILSDKGYISNLYAGIETQMDDNSLLQITVELSEKGFSNKDEIIETIFQYIKNISDFLNSIENSKKDNKLEEIYDEIRTLQKIHFNNWHNPDPIETVQYVASILTEKYIKPENVFNIGTLLAEYNLILPNLKRVFNQLRKNNCSIVISSKMYENTLSLTEEHYGISYELTNDINTRKSLTIKNFIPETNKFISTENKLIDGPDDKFPKKTRNNKIKGYKYFNSSFGVCDTIIFAQFEIPKLFESRENWLGFILFLNALYSDNNATIYTAHTAGYEISLTVEHKSFIMKISGLTNKISSVLSEIVNMINSGSVREIAFESAKDIMRKSFINEKFNPPIEKAYIYLKKLLLNKYFESNELLEIIDSITLETAFDSFKNVLELSNCTVLVSGNIKNSDAENIFDSFEQIYKKYVKTSYNPILSERNDVKNVFEYTEKIKASENPSDKNSSSVYTIELCKYTSGITSGWEKLALLTMFSEVYFSNKYFDLLRTKEQLGYIVNVKKIILGDPQIKNVYLAFNVQSPVKKSKYLFERTTKFIEESKKDLLKLKDDEFEQYRQGLILQYSEPFHNLDEITSYFWGQIAEGMNLFNKREILLETIKKITKQEIIDMLKTYVIENDKIIACGIQS